MLERDILLVRVIVQEMDLARSLKIPGLIERYLEISLDEYFCAERGEEARPAGSM